MKVIIPFNSFKDDPSMYTAPEITVRNGRGEKVRILRTDSYNPDYPIVGLVESENSNLLTYTRDGKYKKDNDTPDEDLIIEVDNDAIKKKTGFDPLMASLFAAAVFGDGEQYSLEEIKDILLLSLLITTND